MNSEYIADNLFIKDFVIQPNLFIFSLKEILMHEQTDYNQNIVFQ